MATPAVIDRVRLDTIEARENARFVAERPKSMALLERSRRTMPRGVPMTWMDDLYEHPPVFVAHGQWLGATVSLAHTAADVDHYVDVFGQCLADLVGARPW